MHSINHCDREILRCWATDLEDNTLRQAEKSARCAAVAGPIALMPDAHLGIGATVGSVIPTADAIIPAAVGVDIGCGMIAVHTNLDSSDLPSNLGPVLGGFASAIPAGFTSHSDTTRAADRWLGVNPVPEPGRLEASHHRKIGAQLGTLGGGNHFVELSVDEDDGVWLVLHSGSRGIGNRLAQRHITDARRLCSLLDRALEDRDLAYFLDTDAAFNDYITDMLWSQAYALENRELMMDAALAVVRTHVHGQVLEQERINCHHNYSAREVHDGRELWITRKGAIRAAEGDRGVIPGSMGTGTYIVSGLGNTASYNSAAHGAGRRFGRREAHRRFTAAEFTRAMRGRTWQNDKAKELLDESPMAYKDISRVMADQADLVRVDHVLQAVVNYKGTN